tara:strand:- start:41 stop:478 length:438 start_codon:yes stop_codon:yes gene_type:complete
MFGSALSALRNTFKKPVVFYELLSTTPNRVTRSIENVYRLHHVDRAVIVPKTFISTDSNVRQKDIGFFTRLRGELYVKRSDITFTPDKLVAMLVDGERLEVRQFVTNVTDYYMFFVAGFTEDAPFSGTFKLSVSNNMNIGHELGV